MENQGESLTSSSPSQQAENRIADNKKMSDAEKTKKYKLEKGAEALLRVTLRNHMDLSDMADRKASLLITINTLVISVAGSVLYTRLGQNPSLIPPTILIVGTALTTIILAIVSTRPKISKGRFTTRQVQNKAVNLLFFGNFHKMSLKDFQWATDEMLHDREYMFDAITQDIHSLGIVVARKYKFLHMAYNVFMYGLILTIVAFVGSFLFGNKLL